MHFFCELSKLNSQQNNNLKSFGPIDSTIYNLTSRHSLNSASKAYVMFKGSIRYQYDNTNSSTLNAILKPNTPSLFKNIPPVKYIIYRGINKNSIFDSTNQTTFLDTISETNHIVNKITADGQIFDQDNYLSLGLGIKDGTSDPKEVDIADTEDLDRLFFSDVSEFEVKSGDIIGEFASDFGIDVILEGNWRKPTLDIVRNVDVTSSGSGNQITSPNSKGDKEQILHYMDIAALIGCFYKIGITTDQGVKRKNSLYTDVLTKFFTKNRVYIDIRNHNNLSLNFYDHYGPNIQLNDIQAQSGMQTWGYSTQLWPILILEGSGATQNFIGVDPNEEKTQIEIALPTGYVDPTNKGNTLQLCFLKHAPLYRKEKLLLINRWPHYEKGEEKFQNLYKPDEPYTISLKLSSYLSNNNDVVAFYFRLFYARQTEDQSSLTNKEVAAENFIDNLWNLEDLTYYEDMKTSSYGIASWFDGNERYLENYCAPGMYKTGVAIGTNNIVFFAVPYKLTMTKDYVSPKYILTKSFGNTDFFKLLSKNFDKDIQVKKLELGSPTRKVFHLFTNASENGEANFDHHKILAFAVSRSEYQQITTHFSGLNSNQHPIFLQLDNLTYFSATKIPSGFFEADFRLTGYSSNIRSTISLNGASDPKLVTTEELVYNTDSAVTNEGLQEADRPSQIFIDHASNSIEYEEIRDALFLVKRFYPKLFRQVESLICNGKVDELPVFEDIQGNKFYKTHRKEKRFYSVVIKYESLGNQAATLQDPNGNGSPILALTDTDFWDSGLTQSGQPIKSNYHIQTSTLNGVLPINKADYEPIALTPNIKPSEIAEQYKPKIKIYNRNTSSYDEVLVEDIKNTGRAAIDNNVVIKLNSDLRGTSSNPIVVEANDPITTQIKILHTFKIGDNTLTQYRLDLANNIAHELAHFLFSANNPLLDYAYYLLEKEYSDNGHKPDVVNNYNPNDTNKPSFSGKGHIEGNPSGNYTAFVEYELGKNLIENFLWVEGIEYINKEYKKHDPLSPTQLSNLTADIYNYKITIKPFYLHDNFSEIRNYLKGNLSESQVIIPKL